MALTQPKKPVGGAFGVFVSDKRPEFLKACAGQKASAVSKMAGEEWKKVGEAERAAYQKRYEAAKAQFEKDKAAFVAGGGEFEKGSRALRSEKKALKLGKAKKKVKDADAPKRPAGGAYGCYLGDQREEIKKSLPSDHKITDVSKKAGELWKALPEAEKQKYEAMYKAKKDKFDAEMAEYKENHKTEDNEAEEKGVAKEKKEKKAKVEKVAPPAKRGRKIATPFSSRPGVELSEDILGKARALGYESQLRNLSTRPEVVAAGKAAEELLKALQQSNGLVNPAKHLLCGA